MKISRRKKKVGKPQRIKKKASIHTYLNVNAVVARLAALNTTNSATIKKTHALFDAAERNHLGHFRLRKRVFANRPRPELSDYDIVKYHRAYVVPTVAVGLDRWHESVSHKPLSPAALKKIAGSRAREFIGSVRSIRQ